MFYYGSIDYQTRQPNVVVCEDNGSVLENLDNLRQKTDRFSWGHGGSSSADLAYSILRHCKGGEIAQRFFQLFKWERVALFDKHSWRISQYEIDRYIKLLEDKNDKMDS